MNEARAGLPIVGFENGAAFEAWLAAEPWTSAGLWVKLAKKGSGIAGITHGEAIEAALCHGWIDGLAHPCDEKSWLLRFTPRKKRSKWSQINRDRALALIASHRMRKAGLAEVEAAKADGRWEAAYAPQSKAEIPPDLQAALDANPEAAAFFATLKSANRYAILYRVTEAKRPETRARRIEKFIAMLERKETIHPG